MKLLLIAFALPVMLAAHPAQAQVPTGAPAGSTGMCKDGTYTDAASKRGACRGHKGVKAWFASETASAAAGTEKETKRSSKRSTVSTEPAAAPAAGAQAGSTGLCKDGSYTTAPTKRGACRGHKGVKEWYGGDSTAAAAAKPATASTPSTPAIPVSPPATTRTPTAPTAASAPPATNRTLAPGGGMGKVWVNTETKVYHCPSDRYYGRTKQGEYMTESEAIAKGDHAAHGKACSQ